MTIRRTLLLVGLGALGVLIWQNWQVSFPIVFLFWRTPAYPLGLLILAGLCLGALLGIIVTLLWSMGQNVVVKPAEPPRRNRPQPPPETEPDLEDWFDEPTTSPRRESWSEARNVTPQADQLPRPRDVTSDPPEVAIPEVQVPEPETMTTEPAPRPERKPRRPRPTVRQEVVDAEFRVLTPPYNAPRPAENTPDNQDWGDWLEDEEDQQTINESNRRF